MQERAGPWHLVQVPGCVAAAAAPCNPCARVEATDPALFDDEVA